MPSASGLSPSRPAVFLDRDGVLVEDVGLLQDPEQIRILPGVPQALARLKQLGFALVVVSNQPVVARGLLSCPEVEALQAEIEARLRAAGAPSLDGFFYCPHHPKADVEEFRLACDCRKPSTGLVRRAGAEMGLWVGNSYFIGDRPTDILCGHRSGCLTILLRTGQHLAPPIQTAEAIEHWPEPDHACDTLLDAAIWIEAQI